MKHGDIIHNYQCPKCQNISDAYIIYTYEPSIGGADLTCSTCQKNFYLPRKEILNILENQTINNNYYTKEMEEKITERDYIYINYYQMMAFMAEINNLKKTNSNYNNDIIEAFEQYMIYRTSELVRSSPLSTMSKNSKDYEIPTKMFIYLNKITGIDVLDKKTMIHSKKSTKELEKNIINEMIQQELHKRKK